MENQSLPPPLPQEGGRQRPSPPPPPPHGSPGPARTFLQSCLVAGCATVLAPFVIVFGLVAFFFLVAAWVGVGEGSITHYYPAGEFGTRVVRAGAPGAGTIAIVNVQGVIDGSGSPLDGDGMLFRVAEQLRQAREDDSVRAVLLQIDSPGGGLTASDLLHNEVKATRAAGKTVLAWAGGLMASGGYYIAAGAEGVMASPTATVGSIGVIMEHFQLEDLLHGAGIEVDPIVSADHKDIGSIFREMTEDERALLQEYVDAAHGRFVQIVAEGRGLPTEDVAPLADGRIFTATQALENKLIDRVGYAAAAIDWTEELVGERNMRVVAFRRMLSLDELLSDFARSMANAVVRARTGTRMMAIGDAR